MKMLNVILFFCLVRETMFAKRLPCGGTGTQIVGVPHLLVVDINTGEAEILGQVDKILVGITVLLDKGVASGDKDSLLGDRVSPAATYSCFTRFSSSHENTRIVRTQQPQECSMISVQVHVRKETYLG